MFEHMMVDIETLGTKPGSVILSIGAVAFSPYHGDLLSNAIDNNRKFSCRIDLQSAMDYGLTIDSSTLLWWMKQSDQARYKAFEDGESLSLNDALVRLCAFIKFHNIKYAWGNSASFDLGLLSVAFDKAELKTPWPFWGENCYRTIKNVAGVKGYKEIERVGLHHDALDDALHQAKNLQSIYDFLNF